MRIFNLFLFLLLVLVQYHLWLGKNGLGDYADLAEEVALQEEANLALKDRNERMFADIADLKQGVESVEERARNELGLIKEGETFFRIIPKQTKSYE